MTTSSWECKLFMLKKTKPEQLLEEIADKLITYLKNGQISPHFFKNKLNLNINSMRELLRLHFVLKDEVVQFIQCLPERIRYIKTSTLKEKQR